MLNGFAVAADVPALTGATLQGLMRFGPDAPESTTIVR